MRVVDRVRSWMRGSEQRIMATAPGLESGGSLASFLALSGMPVKDMPPVTVESALRVPAVLAAVTFLSRTMATVPLHAYKNSADGPTRIKGGLETIIHEAPNTEWSSWKLRLHFWTQVFTHGRGLMWIERSGSNIVALWPMNAAATTIKRDAMGRTTYEASGRVYPASDVVDVPFLLRDDGLTAWSPIDRGADAIQLAAAMTSYGATFFAGGGVPPLALFGPLPQGAENIKRATDDVLRAVRAAKGERSPIVGMPSGHELRPIGLDPEKGQMIDGRRFQTEEIARVYDLPPVFLQDLTRATFSNAEQQDLHLVKHLIGQWAQALEQEMNLKLFGQRNLGRFVEHNVDGLLRGDFRARMEGLSKAIQTAILTPNEARALENRQALEHGDALLVQGAMVPLGSDGGQTTDGGVNEAGTTGADGAA